MEYIHKYIHLQNIITYIDGIVRRPFREMSKHQQTITAFLLLHPAVPLFSPNLKVSVMIKAKSDTKSFTF